MDNLARKISGNEGPRDSFPSAQLKVFLLEKALSFNPDDVVKSDVFLGFLKDLLSFCERGATSQSFDAYFQIFENFSSSEIDEFALFLKELIPNLQNKGFLFEKLSLSKVVLNCLWEEKNVVEVSSEVSQQIIEVSESVDTLYAPEIAQNGEGEDYSAGGDLIEMPLKNQGDITSAVDLEDDFFEGFSDSGVLDNLVDVLPEGFKRELSNLQVDRENLLYSLRNYCEKQKTGRIFLSSGNLSSGRRLENKFLNLQDPKYVLDTLKISIFLKLLSQKLDSKRDDEEILTYLRRFIPKRCFKDFVYKKTKTLEISKIDRPFLDMILRNYSDLFLFSNFLGIIHNGGDLSVQINTFYRDKERYLGIWEETKKCFLSEVDVVNGGSLSRDDLMRFLRELSRDTSLSYSELKEKRRFYLKNYLRNTNFFELISVFYDEENKFFDIPPDLREVLSFAFSEMLRYLKISFEKKFNDKFQKIEVDGTFLFEKHFFPLLFSLCSMFREPELDRLIREEGRLDLPSMVFKKISDFLIKEKIIDSSADLSWINTLASPLDYFSSADFALAITKGDFKDFVFRFDVTLDSQKVSKKDLSIKIVCEDEKRSSIEKALDASIKDLSGLINDIKEFGLRDKEALSRTYGRVYLRGVAELVKLGPI